MQWRIEFEDGSAVYEDALTIAEAILNARLDRTLADVVRNLTKTKEHEVVKAERVKG